MITITFLGTTAGMPTRERGHSAIALKRDGEVLLFDCGENTQRQLILANISPMKIDKIFLTHWHADHFAGLPGLIQSMSLRERKKPLYLYGPKHTKRFISELMGIGQFSSTFKIVTKDIKDEGIVCAEKGYTVYSLPAKHSVEALSYKFEEMPKPGKFDVKKAEFLGVEKKEFKKLQDGKTVRTKQGKVRPDNVLGPERKGICIVYSGDTGYNAKLVEFSKGADVLIHESTFGSEFKKKAGKIGHSTTIDAAKLAKEAKVKKLVLTHISARYTDPKILLAEAQKLFSKTRIANDLMEVKVK